MNRCLLAAAALVAIAPSAAPAASARRFALIAGANRGPADRAPLRYALSDAEGFAGVVQQMGGVAPADCLVLREPSRAAMLAAMGTLRAKVMAARGETTRTEVILYYSGHADDQGLLLGREMLSYRDLRAGLADLAADVNIAVLDACASGAITRIKGGQTHPAFLSDASSQMQGYAFLTSSSEDEAAQESERIQGSYFTHALLTGLRGGADATGDGRITLNEAYQFAFAETLAQTTPTQGGAQHPAYDIKMSGTGDVVMTDVRQMGAALLLGPELDGRIFVRNARRQLIAELQKPAGRTVELGLEAGIYDVSYEQESAFLGSRVTIEAGQRRALMRQELSPRRRFATRRRGLDPREGRRTLGGRSRIELRGGLSEGRVSVSTNAETVNASGAQFALTGLHWVRDDLAIEATLAGTDMQQRVQTIGSVRSTATDGVMAVLCGLRYYVPVGDSGAPVRPFVGLALGPHTDLRTRTAGEIGLGGVDGSTEVTTENTNLGAYLGGGVDAQIGRHFVLGLYSGTTLRSGQRARLGLGFSFGWAFGRGR